MKRGLFIKSFFGFALAFLLANGLLAQTTPTGYNTTAYVTGGDIHIMEGKTVPVFALPDPYYHPSYSPATDVWTVTAGFTWTWTPDAGITAGGASDNYVELTADAGSAAGSPYNVAVTEDAPAAWGGCSGGAQNITVNVYTQPAVTLGGDNTYEFCEGSGSLPAGVTATISGGYDNYRVVWSLEIKTLNADGTDNDFYDNDKTTTPVALAESFTAGAPDASLASGANDITSIAGGYTVIDNSTTVYTYTTTEINDQASRNGDFIARTGDASDASLFVYYAAAETVEITVHPTPVTGPIYHIPTTWAN